MISSTSRIYDLNICPIERLTLYILRDFNESTIMFFVRLGVFGIYCKMFKVIPKNKPKSTFILQQMWSNHNRNSIDGCSYKIKAHKNFQFIQSSNIWCHIVTIKTFLWFEKLLINRFFLPTKVSVHCYIMFFVKVLGIFLYHVPHMYIVILKNQQFSLNVKDKNE